QRRGVLVGDGGGFAALERVRLLLDGLPGIRLRHDVLLGECERCRSERRLVVGRAAPAATALRVRRCPRVLLRRTSALLRVGPPLTALLAAALLGCPASAVASLLAAALGASTESAAGLLLAAEVSSAAVASAALVLRHGRGRVPQAGADLVDGQLEHGATLALLRVEGAGAQSALSDDAGAARQ